MLRLLARTAVLSFVVCALALVGAAAATAASVAQTGTELTYTGDGTADDVQVRQISATVLEIDAGTVDVTEATDNCFVIVGGFDADGGDDLDCSGPTWTAVFANLGDGADKFLASVDLNELQIPATVDGGAAYDDIIGGSGPDTLITGAGGGILRGSSGNDTFRSTLVAGENLTIWAGTGNDTIDLTGTGAGARPLAIGEDGNDTFTGGAGDMIVQGGTGDDTINGGTGNEQLQGEEGLDTINGGAGDDRLIPDRGVLDGADTLSGGAGSDTVDYIGRATPVTVDLRAIGGQGGAGENDMFADDIEHVIGGSANDTLIGDEGANILEGAAGADNITGNGGYDQLRGGKDADTINAESDNVPDLVSCGTDFTTAAPVGADTDVAILDYVDSLDPGADCETVNRAAPPTLAPQGGTAGNDTITGTPLADLIFGLAGDDMISGGDGNDELHGNAGSDTLNGDGGNDELVGNADDDTLRGGDGSDALDGRGGADRLFGDNGADVLDGGADNDALAGGSGNDELDGRDGADSLLGQAGADDLRGDRGADRLAGGAGDDLLVGGANPDRMDGGPGRDWHFARDGARDTITCTKVNLRIAAQRNQRDYVVADRLDRIVNRAWCARVVVL